MWKAETPGEALLALIGREGPMTGLEASRRLGLPYGEVKKALVLKKSKQHKLRILRWERNLNSEWAGVYDLGSAPDEPRPAPGYRRPREAKVKRREEEGLKNAKFDPREPVKCYGFWGLP